MLQIPGEVELCRSDLKGVVKSPADFKGRSLGITDTGSSTDFLTQYLSKKNGVRPGAGDSPWRRCGPNLHRGDEAEGHRLWDDHGTDCVAGSLGRHSVHPDRHAHGRRVQGGTRGHATRRPRSTCRPTGSTRTRRPSRSASTPTSRRSPGSSSTTARPSPTRCRLPTTRASARPPTSRRSTARRGSSTRRASCRRTVPRPVWPCSASSTPRSRARASTWPRPTRTSSSRRPLRSSRLPRSRGRRQDRKHVSMPSGAHRAGRHAHARVTAGR